MEKIVNLAKARGFVYKVNQRFTKRIGKCTWDYGNLGVELKTM